MGIECSFMCRCRCGSTPTADVFILESTNLDQKTKTSTVDYDTQITTTDDLEVQGSYYDDR